MPFKLRYCTTSSPARGRQSRGAARLSSSRGRAWLRAPCPRPRGCSPRRSSSGPAPPRSSPAGACSRCRRSRLYNKQNDKHSFNFDYFNFMFLCYKGINKRLNCAVCGQCSVADPGCLSRIPDHNFFHPGSASKNLSILSPKKGF